MIVHDFCLSHAASFFSSIDNDPGQGQSAGVMWTTTQKKTVPWQSL
jgi:hypothetical protein